MKGIILAGGSGTRLYPLTRVTSKQLLPVYDKPMIYYPLSTLMLAGIRDILIISTPQDLPQFERLLGDGSSIGLRLSYAGQPSPDGLAQAFIIGEDFLQGEPCAMILGDNIFYGNGLTKHLREAAARAEGKLGGTAASGVSQPAGGGESSAPDAPAGRQKQDIGGGATIFGYYVEDPERFGIVEFNEKGEAVSIEEKPEHPKSNYCVTGLYFYDGKASEYAKRLKPSARGELEITDLNRIYLEEKRLNVVTLGRGFAWLDTGTMDSLADATEFVRVVENRQGIKISAIEEIAYRNGWMDRAQLLAAADVYGKSPYGQHLRQVAEDRIRY